MFFIRKRIVYILMTEDEKLAGILREYLEGWRGVWWKWLVKYYDDESPEAYHTSSESSRDIKRS